MKTLKLKKLTIEHQQSPIGIDIYNPRIAWELVSEEKNVIQKAYRIQISDDNGIIADTGRIESESSIENTIEQLSLAAMTVYQVYVNVWDNHGNEADIYGSFETGRLDTPWHARWIEPEQQPTKSTLGEKNLTMEDVSSNAYEGLERDFAEFMPVQYIRIPCLVKKDVKRARVYMTAHGVYRLEVNGIRPDDREFAPEITAYKRYLQYQTYDVSELLKKGENILGVTLGDGWWTGRVGSSGESCQYGNKIGLLMETVITYTDGTEEIITGEKGVSYASGPLIFSDIFVGEKYDARKEMKGWNEPGYNDEMWTPVHQVEYTLDNLAGQYGEPVRPIKIFEPKEIIYTPQGDCVVDIGQVLAGQIEFTLSAPEGTIIKLEHSEVLDKDGNFFNNVSGSNKEQTDVYITKEGKQTYRPVFSYHGFRYVRISGWPGEMHTRQFKVYVLSSEMDDIGEFHTSSENINRLQKNIWWSQISNTISIPTDCPQRERAGWTGDVMAFSRTMCFNRNVDALLTRWMKSLRAEQWENGLVPCVIPYMPGYRIVETMFGSATSCGWGDSVILVPYAVYHAYGDIRILEENYGAMVKWMGYIAERTENHHPEDYDTWDEARKVRSKRIWNTDFHYGDWMIPSTVIGQNDGMAMIRASAATKEVVATAYYAIVANKMAEIATILGNDKDAAKYKILHTEIRRAFIEEFVSEKGLFECDTQGLYVIALRHNLVDETTRPLMAAHLCDLIQKNGGCLDTGFLSVPYLMDALCDSGRSDVAYRLLFQNKCPSWLYEVEKGATTIWEMWNAIMEDGTVIPCSFNHYAFGSVGDWMYRVIGGIQAKKAGYKEIKIAPALDCGLDFVHTSEHTPYGKVTVDWKLENGKAVVEVVIPANTTAEIVLRGKDPVNVGSGCYRFETNQPI